MSYEDDLEEILHLFWFEPQDDRTLEQIEEMFRVDHEGNFKLVWNDKRDKILLKFDTQEEHMLFLLKYA